MSENESGGGAPYKTVESLKADLTANNSDVRLPAVEDVFSADLTPESILSGDVGETELLNAGLLPEPEPEPSAVEVRNAMLEELKLIRKAVSDGGDGE